jgi:hypothetical protein
VLTQDAGVELHPGVDVGYGQHQMVEAVDAHGAYGRRMP